MSDTRIMFVGQGASGLPEDRVVNTFHFHGENLFAEDLVTWQAALTDFYTGGTSPGPLGRFISPWVSRNAQLIAYDMTTAKPRVPWPLDIVLPAALAGGGAPEEVACCISWQCAPPVTRRRRGRTFIGPLCNAAIENATASLPARPTTEFIGVLKDAAVALVDVADPATLWGLSILSVVDNETSHRVVQGYIDNALDTQRRRGPKTTARTFLFL